MNNSQGEIVLIPVPFSDLSSNKPRPAVIISHPDSSSFGNHLFAKVTSNLRDDQFSFPILEDEITENLIAKSEVRTNEIFTLRDQDITKRISSFHQEPFEKLLEQIRKHITTGS